MSDPVSKGEPAPVDRDTYSSLFACVVSRHRNNEYPRFAKDILRLLRRIFERKDSEGKTYDGTWAGQLRLDDRDLSRLVLLADRVLDSNLNPYCFSEWTIEANDRTLSPHQSDSATDQTGPESDSGSSSSSDSGSSSKSDTKSDSAPPSVEHEPAEPAEPVKSPQSVLDLLKEAETVLILESSPEENMPPATRSMSQQMANDMQVDPAPGQHVPQVDPAPGLSVCKDPL